MIKNSMLIALSTFLGTFGWNTIAAAVDICHVNSANDKIDLGEVIMMFGRAISVDGNGVENHIENHGDSSSFSLLSPDSRDMYVENFDVTLPNANCMFMEPGLVPDATTIDFETPTYGIGDLAGQDGWQQSEGNATFITILGPEGGNISGFQSASIVGGAGAAGGEVLSAYKNQVADLLANGTPAYDVNVRFLYRKTQLDGFGGLSISDDGLGVSSAGVRVNENTIEALTADGTYANLGTYGITDIVEFSLDIDVDTSKYQVSVRNESAGETVFTRLTETPLDLQVPLAADSVAIVISGQLGQSIYDEITLESVPTASE